MVNITMLTLKIKYNKSKLIWINFKKLNKIMSKSLKSQTINSYLNINLIEIHHLKLKEIKNCLFISLYVY